MIDRLSARPLVQRGISVATAGLLVAGSLFVPAAVHASGLQPTAITDTVNGTEDTDLVIDASVLLANDTDPEDDVLTVSAVEDDVLDGTVDLVGTTITFHPVADDCGDDTAFFKYDLSDGTNGPSIGIVHVNLACVNDAPVAHPDTEPGHQDDAVVITDHDLVANDDDVDTDNNDLHIAGATGATHGSVSYNPVTHDVTFTPTAGQCNPTEGGFTYTVTDGDKTDTAHVTVTLMCNGPNHDPIATDDVASGTEDIAVHILKSTLLGNDSDVDLDTLSVKAVSNAVGGSAAIVGSNVVFTPAHNLCGPNVARFDYDLFDGTDGDDFGRVVISLTCVNDAPVPGGDTFTVAQASGPVDYDVLVNDTDPEHDPMTVTLATVGASEGTASVVANKVRFTPNPTFHGEAHITYTVSDNHSATAQGLLTVTVGSDITNPTPKAPTAALGAGRVNESAPVRINWSATDAGTGVKSFQVQVSIAGGAFKNVYTGPATSITKAYPFGKTLVWRMRATDKAGNRSGWVTSATRKLAVYQESNGAVHKTGPWTNVKNSDASGKGYAFTTRKGKGAGLQFTGRSVEYVAPKSSASGFVKVWVDGHFIGRFNLHHGSLQQGRIIARASWSANGTHTITIVNDAGGDRTNLDGFVVLR